MRVYPQRIVAVDRFDDAVRRLFGFLYERAEEAVPNDQDARVVFIQVRIVHAVMYAMMRRRVEDVFERPESFYELRVDPELIDQVESVHHGEHPRSKTEKHDRRVEDPVNQGAEPALPHGDAEIVKLARMMNYVKIPEQPRFVADAVEPVVGEIIDEEENHPSPPRIGRELERSERISRSVDQSDEYAE